MMGKRLQRRALACVGVLALGLANGPIPVRADNLTGVVVSVEVAGKKIVVFDQSTSKPVDIGLTGQVDIRTTTGQPLQVQNLKRGDRVGILYNAGLGSRVVVNQAPLRGVVASSDLRSEKFTVTEKGTNRDIDVVLNPDTRIVTPKNESLALKDIKTGDGVSVVYYGAAPTVVMINSKPPELTGHIKSIGNDMRSLVVTELGSSADVKVAVTPKTTIVSNVGKTLEMKDLKKGDGVGIAHQASVASMIVVDPYTAH
jgi:Cu/Ag efflux protein CusF